MLRVSRLSKVYAGEIRAMREISFEVGNGIFGLLGPNGAGKSTLMRTLATLQLPDSGSAFLGDIDLVKEPHRARQVIGYLPQELGVYQRVTAREMLEYLASLKGIVPRRERRNHVEERLERVNLSDAADRRLDCFSGGMKQRFGIAAAFLGKPKLVIVDEPTAGLDPYERRRFQVMLSEAASECVLLLSSHIVEDIAGLCSQMALIDQGEFVLSGSPQELVQSLTGHVWEFSANFTALKSLQDAHRVLSWRPWRGMLQVRVWSDGEPEVNGAVTNGCSVTKVKPDLEDLYAFHISHGV